MGAETLLDLTKIRITLLTSKDTLRKFTCGEAEIDRWATSKALKWTEQNRTKAFVATTEGNPSALGFYSLSFAIEDGNKLSSQKDKDIYKPKGVPLVYLHYLGVNRHCQRNGLGTFLLIDCLRRAHHVSKHVAFYGVGLRSLNSETTKLYAKYGFGVVEPDEPNPLMIVPIWTLNDLFGP